MGGIGGKPFGIDPIGICHGPTVPSPCRKGVGDSRQVEVNQNVNQVNIRMIRDGVGDKLRADNEEIGRRY